MSFPLYLDEDVQVLLADVLNARGFDVLSARDAGRANQGISDEEQLAFAAETGRVLVSYNVRDFMPLALEWQANGREHAGIIVSAKRTPAQQLPRFLTLFQRYPDGFPPNLCMQLPPAVV